MSEVERLEACEMCGAPATERVFSLLLHFGGKRETETHFYCRKHVPPEAIPYDEHRHWPIYPPPPYEQRAYPPQTYDQRVAAQLEEMQAAINRLAGEVAALRAVRSGDEPLVASTEGESRAE
jgi:hypothetical protein